jgi:hypothetical protein
MRTRKKIPYGQPIDVVFTDRERVLISEHTFADPELTSPLDAAERRGTKLIAKYTLDDLDALLGFVAAAANHTKDRKLEKGLRALFARLHEEMKRYDDGEWQSSF